MKFRVPQFIDMEDKIFGPLTLKQFAYILGAGGFSFIIWTFISIKIIAIILIIPVAGLFISLAFVQINGRPFVDVLESVLKYYTGSKIYTWKQPKAEMSVDMTDEAEKMVQEASKNVLIAKADSNKLHSLSLGLDVLDNVEEGEKKNI
jgi:hypothetical protein